MQSPGRQMVLLYFKHSGCPLLALQWCFCYWRLKVIGMLHAVDCCRNCLLTVSFSSAWCKSKIIDPRCETLQQAVQVQPNENCRLEQIIIVCIVCVLWRRTMLPVILEAFRECSSFCISCFEFSLTRVLCFVFLPSHQRKWLTDWLLLLL